MALPDGILFNFLLWILFWIAFKAVYYLLAQKELNYLTHYQAASLYFFSASCLVIFVFYSQIMPFIKNFSLTPFLLLILFFLVNVLSYKTAKIIFTKQLNNFKHPNIYFARMSYRYMLAKSFEILFQQLLIIALVSFLLELRVSFNLMVLLFALLFSLIHLPLVKIKNVFFGIYFTLAALISAVFFPFLILYIPTGYVYSYILHWLFYLVSGVGFNLYLHSGKERKMILLSNPS